MNGRTTLLGVLALLSGFAISHAAAGDILPDTVETISPVSARSQGEAVGAPWGLGGAITVPLHTHVDAETYQALKAWAEDDPNAARGDALELQSASEPQDLATVHTSFVGLDRPGAANHGILSWPPDTTVGASTTRVLEGANSALRLFTTTGTVLQTQDLNTFFSASTTDGTLVDPKVYFDQNATNHRFYVTALQYNGGTTDATGISRLWLAVSRSAEPANLDAASWCHYSIDSKRNAGTAQSSWSDEPQLGVGEDKLVISANQMSFTLPRTFTFAIIWVINKVSLANNSAACPMLTFWTFQPAANAGDTTTLSLQPVQSYEGPSGASKPAYLINTQIFADQSGSEYYQIWELRNNPPTLAPVAFAKGSITYNTPPNAPQSGTTQKLDTGDVRVRQAAGLSGFIAAVHSSLCSLGGANVSCFRYVGVVVDHDAAGNPTASVREEELVAGLGGVFFFLPGVAVNGAGEVAVVFHHSSATTFLSSAWAFKLPGPNTHFPQFTTFTNGTCPQTLSDRTGDYIGVQAEPFGLDGSFWIAGYRATTISSACLWETQVIKLVP